MTTPTVETIIDAMRDRLIGAGIRCPATVPDVWTTPLATIWPEETDYHTAAQTGGVVHTFRVKVAVGRIAERSSQLRLYGYMSATGATSIRALLEDGDTLDGTVQQTWVRGAEDIGAEQNDAETFLAVDFIVEVLA